MKLSPKTKRNISRILPFGLIWLICSWVFTLTEFLATGNQNLRPETDINLTLPVLVFASFALTVMGLFVGTIETVFLERRFQKYSLKRKIAYKFGIYLTLFMVAIAITYPIAQIVESGMSFTDEELWEKMGRFYNSLTFVGTLFQLSVFLLVSLIYAAISENLGHHVLLNLFTGKYNKPVVEERIFMFLDMTSSTTIAESLGHVRYFELLQEYYDLMSNPIINCYGEVYQYIGDEIVTSWTLDKGLADSNCIRCFFEIQKSLAKKQAKFVEKYGFELGFKAGIHFGEVTIGEVGALKKEVVFTGDVLNTTARIQSKCKELGAELLISNKLKKAFPDNQFNFISKGVIELRGREEKEELFEVSS